MVYEDYRHNLGAKTRQRLVHSSTIAEMQQAFRGQGGTLWQLFSMSKDLRCKVLHGFLLSEIETVF